ncbi:MAG: hypothetical protein R2911_41045 [Caldilineaceae bacterium]
MVDSNLTADEVAAMMHWYERERLSRRTGLDRAALHPVAAANLG